MFGRGVTSVTICTIFLLHLRNVVDSYVIPEPTFELLKPQGIRISIPDEPGMRFVAFQGNVNSQITSPQTGEISGDIYRAKNGKWTVEKRDISLKNGDIINYWVHAQVDDKTYKKENQRWTVGDKPTETSATSTKRPEVSDNELLFNEDFDSLNNSIWSRDVKMPLAPDYEFCVYHNEHNTLLLRVSNGILQFQPLILEDYYGENATAYGTMQLSGCTSSDTIECTRKAMSFSILPPVMSARLNTKNSFFFRYGKIEFRAKFPEGDWLYPEILLKPKYESYGRGYSSGSVILGLARGNNNLVNITDRTVYDSRRLDFGFRISENGGVHDYIVSKIRQTGRRWTHEFHVYTTIWNHDGFQFFVDGEEAGRLIPGTDGWLHNKNFDKIAPFDEEFYITIGVGAGGIRVFPDGTRSAGKVKPWKNVGAKAMLKFWHARDEWLPSWRQDMGKKTVFEIDYIRVWSL